MCHTALLDAKFHAFLLDIDEDLAAETRARACRRCGSRLHRDRYPRNPRGRSRNLVEAYRHRLSFTCSICDKRHTPASVRFVGRRVYLAVAVVLTSAVRTGLTDWRVSRLTERILVPKRTVDRSKAYDSVVLEGGGCLSLSRFWVTARGQFIPPPAAATLPASLLECFKGPDLPSQLIAALQFLAPLGEGP
jgi:hypothetical protein